MPGATVNGTELYYETRGMGPACLALHGGLGFDHQYLKRTLTPLETRLRMVYFDHRGNGRSGRPPIETLTMEQLADDAAALMDVLGIEAAVVLGHSYGGFVAQEFALRHPGRLRGLVLIDTTPGQLGGSESPADEQGPPIPAEMAELMSTAPGSDAEFEALAPRMLPFYLHSRPVADLEALVEGAVLSATAMVRGFEVLAGWSSVDRLSTVTAPALLLWGKHDLVCSLPQAYRIARRLPTAEVEIFEQSGHFPWIEEPGAFFAALESWLARHSLA